MANCGTPTSIVPGILTYYEGALYFLGKSAIREVATRKPLQRAIGDRRQSNREGCVALGAMALTEWPAFERRLVGVEELVCGFFAFREFCDLLRAEFAFLLGVIGLSSAAARAGTTIGLFT